MPVLDDAPDAVPTPAPMTEAERQQRIRDNETEIARLKRSAARMSTQITAPARVSKPALAVPRPATPAPAASQRPAPATVAPAPVTSLRDCATAAAPRCVTPQAAPAVAASVTELATPKRFQLKPRKYDRAHLEAVLKAGPLARAAIVKALKAAPFSYGNTLAYTTLQRFGDSLEETPAGLLAWKGAN